METGTQLLIGVAASGLLAAATFTVYRWWQRRRIDRVEQWVKDYLSVRYGELPCPLSINCSEDPLWPVLVAFREPRTDARHSLQFACGARPPCTLISESVEGRQESGPAAGCYRGPSVEEDTEALRSVPEQALKTDRTPMAHAPCENAEGAWRAYLHGDTKGRTDPRDTGGEG